MQSLLGADTIMGLLTLTILELVLGIDNLVFISLLAEKLPPEIARKASITGLSCALIMRIILLLCIGWAVGLTKPLFTIFGLPFAARNLIMLFGGAFLLAKGTMELHERLEGDIAKRQLNSGKAVFWQVIAQIIVLDAIFSLDSIITAVGIVHHIPIMIIAVSIAMALMMLASKPLMGFINKHPTVVMLCLGFLMMIGFSLVVEGFGFHIPKGYLYAAISFSIIIEGLNQLAQYSRKKQATNSNDLRSRTADMVLRLLGGVRGEDSSNLGENTDMIAEHSVAGQVFKPEEKEMIRGVLDLADRPVRSIMSPRNEIEWLDLSGDEQQMRQTIANFKHSRVILARDKVDEFVGVALTKDLVTAWLDGKKISWKKFMRQPLVVHENTNVLSLMEKMRQAPVQMAIIVDEHGSFEGVATPTDIFEAITGDFLREDDEQVVIEQSKDGSWLVEAFVDIRYLSGVLNTDLVDEGDRYTTLAGYMLWHFGHIPVKDESFEADGFYFVVIEMEQRNISQVRITPIGLLSDTADSKSRS
ncbi:MAG: TerC family protein [Alphaproteobacteria bacterium]|nr:TerC family protein [Alphaproteobacteria bacterium]